jgi:hypothetical protein
MLLREVKYQASPERTQTHLQELQLSMYLLTALRVQRSDPLNHKTASLLLPTGE